MQISGVSKKMAYAVIAIVAFVGTWSNYLAYFHLGPIGGTLQFWKETLESPASRSITVDISFPFMAIAIWMVLEARRLNMKNVWIYILLGVLVAISVTFPLFMMSRERSLELQGLPETTGEMNRSDLLGLLLLAILFLSYTIIALLA